MVMQHAKPGRVALAVMGALLVTALPAHVSYAEGFIDDSTLTGGLYYWQRDRDRKQVEPGSPDHGKYKANLHHSSANANLDFSSGYLGNFIGIDLAAFGALELNTSGPAAPNEIGFSDAKSRWDEKWTGDRSGMSVYKAAAKFKLGNFWAKGGISNLKVKRYYVLIGVSYQELIAVLRRVLFSILIKAVSYRSHICGRMNTKHRGIGICITSVKLT